MKMRNIQIIDKADNCVYDIFQIEESGFELDFKNNSDIAFIEDLERRQDWLEISSVLEKMRLKRIPKIKADGMHGIIFYGLLSKRKYYPTLRDEEAQNPNGSLLR